MLFPFSGVRADETERFVFAREKEDHLYTSAAFFWSKTIAEFPLEILQQVCC